MKKSFADFLSEIKTKILIIRAKELEQKKSKFKIIDVREDDEVQSGIIPGAIPIPRGTLELNIESVAPLRGEEIIIYCAGGTRSALAAESLNRMGYEKVYSLDGGIKAWKDAGFVIETVSKMDESAKQRYSAQMRLPQIGELGQEKISAARVLIVGAGGLGSPVGYYLAAAGVGTIGIIDDDVVDLTNLQRQILHTTDRIGLPKVDSAFLTLKSLNPQIKVKTYQERLTRENVDKIFPEYDLIVDGCDNFQTRYLVNDACLKHKKLNVHGSIFWFEGQVTTYCADEGPCYRCLFPEPPSAELSPNCAEAGVLGVLPGLYKLM